jgi:hypothetical protein
MIFNMCTEHHILIPNRCDLKFVIQDASNLLCSEVMKIVPSPKR